MLKENNGVCLMYQLCKMHNVGVHIMIVTHEVTVTMSLAGNKVIITDT